MTDSPDLDALAEELRRKGEAFALATVVRTVASVSAKPGAKAIISANGEMHGWIGGGCALGAVKKAAMRAIADGETRLVSVVPSDQLKEKGVIPGEEREGVEFAKNMCPSRGVVDVFIEPMLPKPKLFLCGGTPVAHAIADLAPRFGFAVSIHLAKSATSPYPASMATTEGFATLSEAPIHSFIVIATQGQGDEAALQGALNSAASYVAFVGSRRKIATLKERLMGLGVAAERIASLRGPAGIPIGAVTPEEIALSIVADVIKARREGQIAKASGRMAAAG